MRIWMLILAVGMLAGLWAAPALGADPPSIERWENGARGIVLAGGAAPVVSVEVLIGYSALDEPPTLQGLRQSLLTAMLMAEPDSQRALAAAGGSLRGQVHQDMLEVCVTAPADALPLAVQTLGAIVCRPPLSDEMAQAAVRQMLAREEVRPTTASEHADRLARSLVYKYHPYVMQTWARPAAAPMLTPEVLRWAHKRYVVPATTVVALVGRCDPEEARLHLKGVFGLWTGGPAPTRPTYDPPRVPQTRIELRQEAVNNACVMLAFPGPGAADPDFLPLRLLDTVLSAGTSSRLFREIRETRKLSYETATSFPPQQHSAHMALYAVVNQHRLDEAKQALVDVLAAVQATPVPADELARAKAYLKGRYLLSHQYSAQHAFDLAWYELLGLGADFDGQFAQRVDAVTAEDMQRVARAWFTRYYLVVVMPNTAASPTIPGLG